MAYVLKDDQGQFYTREGDRVVNRDDGEAFDDIPDVFGAVQRWAIDGGAPLPVASVTAVEVRRTYGLELQ